MHHVAPRTSSPADRTVVKTRFNSCFRICFTYQNHS
ncbi:hypothetical protein PVAP13_3NG281141 [Panicum virgatum]|uniref:Uncharacterized protein n=1 Tax=Panicum virgatum TaxID=38727 RepID=A0A8T0UMZ9_PANVG|nr:hypothetical protein PVAP13_3NG281141 [Panicum virgatum]